MNKISTRIENFYNQVKNDSNHRFKSWEHCYSYFSRNKDKINIEEACLHLSFYLASWGMYRGSSFLLWKDYLIHKEVVEKILIHKNLQNINYLEIDPRDEKVLEVFDLIEWIQNWYPNKIETINGISKRINVTDTLVTKILLGTLGCVPAYDKYFKDGLKKQSINPKLSMKNYLKLITFYQNNKNEFNSILIGINNELKYPVMKLIDMYFWQIGFENKIPFAKSTVKSISQPTKGKINSNRWHGDKSVKQIIWESVREFATNDTTKIFSPQDICWIVLNKYPNFSKSTVGCQIISDSVNHTSRHHYPGGEDRYWWNGKGKYKLYDPTIDK